MESLRNLLKKLDGKKTYLATIALGLVGLAWNIGWISDEVAQPIMIVLASTAGLSFRQAVSKVSAPVDAQAADVNAVVEQLRKEG